MGQEEMVGTLGRGEITNKHFHGPVAKEFGNYYRTHTIFWKSLTCNSSLFLNFVVELAGKEPTKKLIYQTFILISKTFLEECALKLWL